MRARLLSVVLLSTASLPAWAQTMPAIDPTLPAATPQTAIMPPAPATPAPATLPEVQVPAVPAAPAMPPATPMPQPDVIAPAPDSGLSPESGLLPAVPAGAATQPGSAPGAAAPAPAVVDLKAPFSFGTNGYSLMFSPSQIDNMKRALSTFEMLSRTGQVNPEIEIIEEQSDTTKALAEEPAEYPVFSLSSIVFRSAGDWTVWISGLRITPKTNEQEVRVIGISAGQAQFSWKPVYNGALKERVQNHLLADPTPLAHKMTKPNTAIFDQQSGQAVFSLRPNQTFVPAYMTTFEGRVPGVTLPALRPENAKTEEPTGAVGAPATDQDGALPPGQVLNEPGVGNEEIRALYDKAGGSTVNSARSTLESLQSYQKSFQGMTPQKDRAMPPSNAATPATTP